MKVVVLQSNYIPWKGYFDLIKSADVFCFYDEVKYTKNDWRNRNKIVGPNGAYWLTIPVEKESVNKKISEVEFRDTKWINKHIMSIKQSYAKAPFKKDVMEMLEPLYLEAGSKSLSEFNKMLIEGISGYIGLATKFDCSSNYTLTEGRVERLVGLLKDLETTTYVSGPAAKRYLAESHSLFKSNNIELVFKEYGPYKKYDQKLTEFNDYVSVLDLLMNVPRGEISQYI
ncbi:WbqC family protein [Salibacteraceae bacterium]|mgnify:FL=1|jgi:hypothetical protein|nr:WbqC family protein [Salibacteraceae bacterium]